MLESVNRQTHPPSDDGSIGISSPMSYKVESFLENEENSIIDVQLYLNDQSRKK